MSTFEEAVEAQRHALAQKEDKIPWKLGYLGDTAGVVNTSSSNKVLVRYPYENSPAHPVLDLIGVARVPNVRVIVGYLPWMPGVFQIIAASDHRLDVSSDSDVTISPNESLIGYNPNVGLHAINHQYLGVDPIYINWRQIMPLGVFPSSGLTVQIFGGYLPHTGADIYIPDQTVDLTASVPGSGARYSLISFNLTTGAVTVTDGTINAGGFSSLTYADIPDTPAGCWRSCAVALYFGQTAIIETNDERDFFDVRWPEEFPAGVSGVTAGMYGDGTHVAQVTFDASGRATKARNVPILTQPMIDFLRAAGGGHTIQDEGTPLTARANLNFVGAGVTATDDAGNNATVVTIPGVTGIDFLIAQVFS